MTQEEKDLLLKDLCARLPYGVIVEGYELPCRILNSDLLYFIYTHQEFAIRRPYLRPMSSMTEEEKVTYCNLQDEVLYSSGRLVTDNINDMIDWLLKNHFDFRGPHLMIILNLADNYGLRKECLSL